MTGRAAADDSPWPSAITIAPSSASRSDPGASESLKYTPRMGKAQRAPNLWVARRRGRQKFRRASEDLVSPQAFADPRLACALATISNHQHHSERPQARGRPCSGSRPRR